jgi:hypothetical protein
MARVLHPCRRAVLSRLPNRRLVSRPMFGLDERGGLPRLACGVEGIEPFGEAVEHGVPVT